MRKARMAPPRRAVQGAPVTHKVPMAALLFEVPTVPEQPSAPMVVRSCADHMVALPRSVLMVAQRIVRRMGPGPIGAKIGLGPGI